MSTATTTSKIMAVHTTFISFIVCVSVYVLFRMLYLHRHRFSCHSYFATFRLVFIVGNKSEKKNCVDNGKDFNRKSYNLVTLFCLARHLSISFIILQQSQKKKHITDEATETGSRGDMRPKGKKLHDVYKTYTKKQSEINNYSKWK